MGTKTSESGMDELIRLSRQTANMGKKLESEEQRKAEHEQNVQGIVEGLRGISFSVALGQLKTLAKPELYEKVKSLQASNNSVGLRRLISDLTRDLEKQTAKASRNDPGLEPIENTAKTLAILISLLFSL